MADDKQICRLCLDIAPTGNAEAIGEKKKAILEVLLIDTDLHIIDDAVACNKCMDELQSSFEFKSACLHVDNCISTFANNCVPVDIKEVFQGEMKGTEMATVNLENRQICRLCMSLIEDEALNCNTDLNDIIANCLPEVDIYTVYEPLVCELCFSRMKKLNEFMKTCQKAEQRINNYCQATADHAIPISVNLNNLLKFNDSKISRLVQGESSNFDKDVLKNPKKEDTASIEWEEIHIKDELDSVEVVSESVPSGACKNPEESCPLKRKRQIRKSVSRGTQNLISKEFSCQECTFETDRKCILAQHMIIHKDKSEVEMHKCKNCEYETRHKRCMIAHMVKHRDPRAEKKFKCDKCSYETDFKCNLLTHNLRHKDRSEVKMHKCPNCDFETRYNHNMIIHMRKHLEPKTERQFKCEKCPCKADRKSNLCKHILSRRRKSEMEMHMVNTVAERKFKCDVCPYETDVKRYLLRHRLIHLDKSEVEMHKCLKCGFETKHKSSMSRHMMKHRNPGADRKFKCDKCPYETNINFCLRSHYLVHKDESEVEIHECANCEYETRYKNNMIQHMRRHHNLKETSTTLSR